MSKAENDIASLVRDQHNLASRYPLDLETAKTFDSGIKTVDQFRDRYASTDRIRVGPDRKPEESVIDFFKEIDPQKLEAQTSKRLYAFEAIALNDFVNDDAARLKQLSKYLGKGGSLFDVVDKEFEIWRNEFSKSFTIKQVELELHQKPIPEIKALFEDKVIISNHEIAEVLLSSAQINLNQDQHENALKDIQVLNEVHHPATLVSSVPINQITGEGKFFCQAVVYNHLNWWIQGKYKQQTIAERLWRERQFLNHLAVMQLERVAYPYILGVAREFRSPPSSLESKICRQLRLKFGLPQLAGKTSNA
jgi:hypothetical protein